MLEIIVEKFKELGVDPNDRECPVINAICPYRKNYKCKYTRLERAILMLDCAFE
jgi:hypothetical protein